MKFQDTGFRPFYKGFTAIMLNELLKEKIRQFPDADQADAVLTYGYMDPQNGMTLEILAAAKSNNNGQFHFFSGHSRLHESVLLKDVSEQEFFWFPDQDGSLTERYQLKVNRLKNAILSEEIETTRYMTFLDEHRDPYDIDDVQVKLIRKGLKDEIHKVRIKGLGPHCIEGILLEEPLQNFGYHQNETMVFFVRNTGENRTELVADMTPTMQLRPEQMEDGSLLRNAMKIFSGERTQDHFIDVLEFLRDSYVYVPCRGRMSPADEERMKRLLDETKGNFETLKGKKFKPQDEVRLYPLILENSGKFFFPVFIRPEDLGDDVKKYNLIRRHILEVIPMARECEREIHAIVVNPYNGGFILEAKYFALIEQMKSRLIMN